MGRRGLKKKAQIDVTQEIGNKLFAGKNSTRQLKNPFYDFSST